MDNIAKIINNVQKFFNLVMYGSSYLHIAVQEEDVDLVEDLTKVGVYVDVIKNGETPLYAATVKGNFKIVKQLVEEGAHVNAKNTIGSTPLHAAAALGYAEIVKYFVAKGADISAKNKYGYTAYDLAMGQNNTKIANLIKEKTFADEQNIGETSFYNIAEEGRAEVDIANKVAGDCSTVIQEDLAS